MIIVEIRCVIFGRNPTMLSNKVLNIALRS